jgi:cathepsin F
MSWKGVETEAEYPYVGEDQTCARNPSLTVAPISNYTCLSYPGLADEDQMAAYLVANGPISIAMDALILEDYSSGIIDPYFTSSCDPTQLDHALVIVGYGTETTWFDQTLNFWIVRVC